MKKDINADLDAREDYLDARRAQSLAGWSYVGLVIPLIGWILAGMSLSTSKDLPREGKIGKRRQSARSNATLSILLSVVVAFIWVVAIANTSSSAKQQKALQTTQAAQQQTQDASQSAIQACEDQAHRQWDQQVALAEGTPGNAYSFDKSQLDQQLARCQYQ
jgi:hypothetical protein